MDLAIDPVVGLTGSSGKTTTRALTTLALSPLGPVHQTVGNLNNHLGVPMTLVAVPPEARAMVVEMGTSAPGEIEFLARMGTPDIRLIVNVGPAHLEELGGLDGVAIEKGAMFRTARPGDICVVNTWDERVAAIELPERVRRIEVGPGGAIDVIGCTPEPAQLATRVRFATPEITLTSKVIDGTFPDYARVIPTGNTRQLEVDAGRPSPPRPLRPGSRSSSSPPWPGSGHRATTGSWPTRGCTATPAIPSTSVGSSGRTASCCSPLRPRYRWAGRIRGRRCRGSSRRWSL